MQQFLQAAFLVGRENPPLLGWCRWQLHSQNFVAQAFKPRCSVAFRIYANSDDMMAGLAVFAMGADFPEGKQPLSCYPVYLPGQGPISCIDG